MFSSGDWSEEFVSRALSLLEYQSDGRAKVWGLAFWFGILKSDRNLKSKE